MNKLRVIASLGALVAIGLTTWSLAGGTTEPIAIAPMPTELVSLPKTPDLLPGSTSQAKAVDDLLALGLGEQESAALVDVLGDETAETTLVQAPSCDPTMSAPIDTGTIVSDVLVDETIVSESIVSDPLIADQGYYAAPYSGVSSGGGGGGGGFAGGGWLPLVGIGLGAAGLAVGASDDSSPAPPATISTP